MARREYDPIDEATVRKVGAYLFDRPTEEEDGKPDIKESQYLDIRTDIGSKQMMNAVFVYRLMHEYFPTPKGAAGRVANVLERLAISSGRGGRKEAVEILRRGIPKVQEIEVGSETRYIQEE